MIRVLIVDDHAIVREGLANVLSSEPGISVVATAASGPEALQRIRDTQMDVVLLDLTMPGMNGMQTLKQIKIENNRLPVLILSMHPEAQYAARCIKAGAAGYLTKACEKKELIAAVRCAASGGTYLSPAALDSLRKKIQPPGHVDTSHRRLSDREFEVFRQIAEGVTLADMARRMNLSPKTLSTYRTRILRKMELASNAELMRYAFEQGLAKSP